MEQEKKKEVDLLIKKSKKILKEFHGMRSYFVWKCLSGVLMQVCENTCKDNDLENVRYILDCMRSDILDYLSSEGWK